ncbi:lycopene cyclase family protein [Fulvivirga sedimenti]|uniref:Lycopene cyclase n=1 Tax=Fulvivirga sedimenti TaxID=2879465 RepID=A0A9X1HNL8_9BACT|nr:lycopene cyclase family protein [Fulvivirga sedimenti]MCA6073499.1 hypothetical protein [Fulvivirga sedimenti]
MSEKTYDFAIVGAGAAGLQLAMAIADDPFFSEKQILIIEKDPKVANDRTWCFWEKGRGRWDDIIHRSWEKAAFNTDDSCRNLDLSSYSYKMLRASDFYAHTKSVLQDNPAFTWVQDEVHMISGAQPMKIEGEQTYQAHIVFDSRVHPDFYKESDSYIRLLQHFTGWVIETEEEVFDPETFTMMDFRVKWPDSTSFTYILPFSKTRALVEFTLFSPALLAENQYEQMLKQYIAECLNLSNYKITELEQGIIPMSDYPFHRLNTPSHIRIGTGGGWVKPSSGYSFKNSGRNVVHIISNLKNGRNPAAGIGSNKFRFYDGVFLEVLYHRNELGEEIFNDMYSKNPPERIFRFLDEETSLSDDLKVITSFRSGPFISALGRLVSRLF